jgi:hypothetical protein
MPRNRTIKPEFYSDSKLAEVSVHARYLYKGTWTFADDYGVVRADTRWLKAMIFPYDNFTMEEMNGWLDDLEKIKRILLFAVNGENYYYIPNFLKHQVIDHPSKWRNPNPPAHLLDGSCSRSAVLAEDSPSARRAVSPESESESEADADADADSACAKQSDIKDIPNTKNTAKSVRRKRERKLDQKKPDYIDQLIEECSRMRFSYRRSIIQSNGKIRSQMKGALDFSEAQWKQFQALHNWPNSTSRSMIRFVLLLYEAFMLEDETEGADTDFARGCNFAFGAFCSRIQKYAEMVAKTKDSYGNLIFVPLEEPEDVLRYDTGCSHESLVRVEAFKRRRPNDAGLIARYVLASGPPYEKHWRDERERLSRGEPRSVDKGDTNAES